MAKLEGIDAPGILGITDQQLNLLKTIYKLNTKNKAATPREIEAAYAKDYGGGIQKSNLFRQMKILQDKGFLQREGEANYKINFDGLKKTLDQRKQEYTQTLQHYEQLTNETEEYFRKTTNQEKPIVEYFENKYFSERMLKVLERASAYYSTTSFPNITYGAGIADTIGRRSYVDVLNRRVLVDKNMELFYLTDFNVEYLFEHILQKISDKEKCLRHCFTIIDQLEDIISKYPNIHVSYQDTPLFLDLHIPEYKDPVEVFSHVRGMRSELLGVLYIHSAELARQNKELFMGLFHREKTLNAENVNTVMGAIRSDLEAKYGKI